MQACSFPPMYKSIGIQYFAFFLSNISFLFLLSQYLKKYHEELTKVSIVSVSLLAFPLHLEHFTLTNSLFVSNGFPFPNSTSSGNLTGNFLSGTGTIPHFSQ